jgi:hypothetical protein
VSQHSIGKNQSLFDLDMFYLETSLARIDHVQKYGAAATRSSANRHRRRVATAPCWGRKVYWLIARRWFSRHCMSTMPRRPGNTILGVHRGEDGLFRQSQQITGTLNKGEIAIAQWTAYSGPPT